MVNFHTLCDRPLVWLAPFTSLIDPPNTTFYCPSCPSRVCISGTSSVATRRRHLKYLFQIGNWDRKKNLNEGKTMSIQLTKFSFLAWFAWGHSLLLPGFLFLALGFAFEMMNDGRHLGVDASDLSFVSY